MKPTRPKLEGNFTTRLRPGFGPPKLPLPLCGVKKRIQPPHEAIGSIGILQEPSSGFRASSFQDLSCNQLVDASIELLSDGLSRCGALQEAPKDLAGKLGLKI